ncbi:amino acid ABC transporter permease [Krasilnikoviella flava]|uniref:Glutamate transport system permease protein n=1 Tax=Krasilnikoviella flava TaxID=526729 RepID=A0A1T5LUJ9_9MICO|nr:ABC transporter permease subunit [Krasilnikoviella flava]SKC79248.1 glutamate transport system permease protein [Krasilnikoviella flava]
MGDFLSQFGELFAAYDVPGAFWVNIQLTFWAAIFSLILGTVLALMRISPIASLQWAGATYVNILRNTPLTVIMTFLFLAVWTQLQISLSDDFAQNFFRFGVIGLTVYHAAFVCESIRSGVNTVPLGQAEAARAIGLSFLPAARLIILPQAFRGAIAPLGNTLIALLKNSTVVVAVSVSTETSTLMREMIESNANFIYAIFMIFAIGFAVLVIPIGLLTTFLSNRLAVRR